MSIKSSADLFAAMGDEWNTPNWQENADPVERHFHRTGRVEVEYRIDGYTPIGKEPTRATLRRGDPVRATPICRDYAGQRRSLPAASDNHWDSGEQILGKAQPLTEAQLQLRKKQRAAVKSRLTRAQNKILAREASRKAVFNELTVKLSQMEF